MKIFALVLFLAGISVASADDNLLRNGDFSSGLSHWEGDCHTVGSSTFDDSITSPPTAGIIVKLRHSDWSKVTQDFDGKVGVYTLTINYSVSPDLKFSDRIDDYTNVTGRLELADLKPFDGNIGEWSLIITDLGANRYTFWKITPKPSASGTQTVNVQVHLDSDDYQKKGFFLAFPPGTGFINLQSITLTPVAATASAQ
jgi:hypothetical protein